MRTPDTGVSSHSAEEAEVAMEAELIRCIYNPGMVKLNYTSTEKMPYRVSLMCVFCGLYRQTI